MEKEQLQEASLADDDNRNSCEERVDPKQVDMGEVDIE